MSRKVFDEEGVMARLDNDKELLFELVDIFLDDYETQLQAIQAAIASSNTKELQESAHAIKGALGNIGAMLAHSVALDLEHAGRAGSCAGCDSKLSELRGAITAYCSEMEKYRAQG